MRKLAFMTVLLLASAPALLAQDDAKHVEVGPYFDYLRLNTLNFYGLGGRFAVLPRPQVAVEGEIAHDFERSVTFSTATTFFRSSFRITDGLFGVRVQNSGPVRVFGTMKTGFINFSVSNGSALAGFQNAIGQISDGDTKVALYPGGGLDIGGGAVSFRVEVGDLMYFANGTHHNLRITAGPQFRF